MAKTYIDIVKYMIEARFEISGSVEKPDIIGAIFGQTEGLLGPDLDLRELQKNGKIGRIEIESGSTNNKTYGKLMLPSSLGKVETCILAAAIESVDRVGPFETNFKIDKIDDTRNEKRNKVINRAKELVKSLLNNVIPDSKEISEMVEADVKSSTVTHYGTDNLPAGPDIAKSDSIVIVEGRADVVNLLKSDITNCIAVGGATGTIPKTIIDLCAQKEVTLFVDGDRGGDIIFKGISNVADIDYVAKAPDGKEVEELTRKEIIKALRSRIPFEQTSIGKQHAKEEQQNQQHNNGNGQRPQQRQQQQRPQESYRNEEKQQRRNYEPRDAQQERKILSPSEIATNLSERHNDVERENIVSVVEESQDSISSIEFDNHAVAPEPSKKYIDALAELKNTLRGRLYDANGKLVNEIPIRDLIQTVQSTEGTNTIVFDGIITQRLIELAYGKGVKEIYGIRSSQITKKYDDLLLYTKE
ncbi:MAG: DNA primase DnaG [Methanothrix sp.]